MALHALLVTLSLLTMVAKVGPEPQYDPSRMIDTLVIVIEVLGAGGNPSDSIRLLV